MKRGRRRTERLWEMVRDRPDGWARSRGYACLPGRLAVVGLGVDGHVRCRGCRRSALITALVVTALVERWFAVVRGVAEGGGWRAASKFFALAPGVGREGWDDAGGLSLFYHVCPALVSLLAVMSRCGLTESGGEPASPWARFCGRVSHSYTHSLAYCPPLTYTVAYYSLARSLAYSHACC